jgi:hypothetical protein
MKKMADWPYSSGIILLAISNLLFWAAWGKSNFDHFPMAGETRTGNKIILTNDSVKPLEYFLFKRGEEASFLVLPRENNYENLPDYKIYFKLKPGKSDTVYSESGISEIDIILKNSTEKNFIRLKNRYNYVKIYPVDFNDTREPEFNYHSFYKLLLLNLAAVVACIIFFFLIKGSWFVRVPVWLLLLCVLAFSAGMGYIYGANLYSLISDYGFKI